ncbi:SDR family oxidoreductase [Arthrobacter sp. 3Tela_A]|uniref:SDR family oxidoreductase n=1 Tax=Arthrobacter sp. 3Tela_A TaxID=3093743 RepID=UPI003BB7B4F3
MEQSQGRQMQGRTVLVTGATGGIGLATAQKLAAMGARLAVTGRRPDRAEAAAEEIRKESGGRVDVFTCDLSSQADLRRLAGEILAVLPRIDVLVNNVGGYWNTRHVTADGLEQTFALNHLAPFLLTNLLLARLRESSSARVVTVSSNAHASGRIDFDDLQGANSYSGARAYSQSKLANVLFTYELARKLEGSRVTANVLHPGIVSTSFGTEDPGAAQRVFVPLLRPLMQRAEAGAATSVRLASASELEAVSGTYFSRGKVRRSSRRSYDQRAAAHLWAISAALTRLSDNR